MSVTWKRVADSVAAEWKALVWVLAAAAADDEANDDADDDAGEYDDRRTKRSALVRYSLSQRRRQPYQLRSLRKN